MFNNKYVKNKDDIKYTADYIEKQYMKETANKPKNEDLFWIEEQVSYTYPKEKVMYTYYLAERLG